jgi:hypothetical protein
VITIKAIALVKEKYRISLNMSGLRDLWNISDKAKPF